MGFNKTINSWLIKYYKFKIDEKLLVRNVIISLRLAITKNSRLNLTRFNKFKKNNIFSHPINCKFLRMCS